MNLKEPIEIECYYDTEVTSTLREMGGKVSFSDSVLKPVTFYSIDVVEPAIFEGKYHKAIITSGGDTFTVNLTYEETKRLIKANINEKAR